MENGERNVSNMDKQDIIKEIANLDSDGVFTTDTISDDFAEYLRKLDFRWCNGGKFYPFPEQREGGIKISRFGYITWNTNYATCSGKKLLLTELYTLFGFPVVKVGYKLYMVSKNLHSQILLKELDGQPEEGYTLTRAKEERDKKLDSLGATSIDIAIAKVENICKQTTKTEVVREII